MIDWPVTLAGKALDSTPGLWERLPRAIAIPVVVFLVLVATGLIGYSIWWWLDGSGQSS